MFVKDYRNRCLTFYFGGVCSRCSVLIMFWQHQFHWRTLGPQIRGCFIRHSFSQHFPAWKNMYSWPVLSCWAKWGLVMGQKCTAGSVKLCEERFNWKFSTETKSTNTLSFTSLLILWELSGNGKNRTRNLSSVWHNVVWHRSQDSKQNLLQLSTSFDPASMLL